MTNPRTPLTRDVRVVAASCAIVQAELLFQVERLTSTIAATANETEYLQRILSDYRDAARAIATLRRYQEGRAARATERGLVDERSPAEFSDDILNAGRDVRPFIIDPERDRA